LHGVAGEPFDAVQGIGHQLCPLGQTVEDRASLLREGIEGNVTLVRGVHDYVHASLKYIGSEFRNI